MTIKYMKKQLLQLKDWIKNWKDQEKRTCILFGKPGIGKSESVYEICKDLGFTIAEFNTSDHRGQEFMARLYRDVRNESLMPVVYLLDEFDGMDAYDNFNQVVAVTRHPIVMTCNAIYKIPQPIIDSSFVISYYMKTGQSLRIAKYDGLDSNFESVSGDVRQSLLAKLGSQGYTVNKTQSVRLEEFLKSGNADNLKGSDYIVLLDNSSKLFYGYFLYSFVQSLQLANKCKNNAPLEKYMSNAKLGSSYFYEKRRVGQDGSTKIRWQ